MPPQFKWILRCLNHTFCLLLLVGFLIFHLSPDGEGDKTDDAGADPAVEAPGEAESAGAEEGSDKSRSSSENDFEVIKKDELNDP